MDLQSEQDMVKGVAVGAADPLECRLRVSRLDVVHLAPPAKTAAVDVVDARRIVEFLREGGDELFEFVAENRIVYVRRPEFLSSRAVLLGALCPGGLDPEGRRRCVAILAVDDDPEGEPEMPVERALDQALEFRILLPRIMALLRLHLRPGATEVEDRGVTDIGIGILPVLVRLAKPGAARGFAVEHPACGRIAQEAGARGRGAYRDRFRRGCIRRGGIGCAAGCRRRICDFGGAFVDAGAAFVVSTSACASDSTTRKKKSDARSMFSRAEVHLPPRTEGRVVAPVRQFRPGRDAVGPLLEDRRAHDFTFHRRASNCHDGPAAKVRCHRCASRAQKETPHASSPSCSRGPLEGKVGAPWLLHRVVTNDIEDVRRIHESIGEAAGKGRAWSARE